MLAARGEDRKRFRVTWGDASKEYPAEQLAKGINLAAEFLDNPFSEPFRKPKRRSQTASDGDEPGQESAARHPGLQANRAC